MPSATYVRLKPFTVEIVCVFECDGFERLSDETDEEGRWKIARELEQGLRQTAYDVEWDSDFGEIAEKEVAS